MTTEPSPDAAPETAAQYDDFAETYAHANENGFFNAWYERPEMLRLAGDVAGKRVLDAGCGHGVLVEALRERGADVSGFDLSPAMIALAKKRLGDDADVRVADASEPLPYADAEFDLVTASLMVHYLQDWTGPLAEFRRVLKPGGRMCLSIIHPFLYAAQRRDEDYFALTQYSDDYEIGGRTVVMTYWHRPLQDVLNAFVAAGFRIVQVTEPDVAPGTPAELHPHPEQKRFLSFLFFELEAPRG